MTIEEQVRRHVIDDLLLGEGDGLLDSASLLDSGVLDSTSVLELVTFLEERFAFTVNDEDLVPANFDSIDRIAAFVRRKLAGVPSVDVGARP